MWRSVLDTLPRGYSLDERDWQRRHRLLLGVLATHVPGLALFGLLLGHAPLTVAYVLVTPVVCLAFGYWLRRRRRTAAVLVTAGLVYSSAALVGLTGGTIEAHFHFFIIIGFIALYQDWAPFLFNIIFTVISHGIGSAWHRTLIFNHPAAQANPWLWSAIHGVAVLLACVGMTLFWRVTEESQREKDTLSRRLANAEIGRRQFASDLLVNLARRNQSMLYRQLDIINQLEESSATRTRWPSCSSSTTWPPVSVATPRACWCSRVSSRPVRGARRCRCVTSCERPSRRPSTSSASSSSSTSVRLSPGAASPT